MLPANGLHQEVARLALSIPVQKTLCFDRWTLEQSSKGVPGGLQGVTIQSPRKQFCLSHFILCGGVRARPLEGTRQYDLVRRVNWSKKAVCGSLWLSLTSTAKMHESYRHLSLSAFGSSPPPPGRSLVMKQRDHRMVNTGRSFSTIRYRQFRYLFVTCLFSLQISDLRVRRRPRL